MKPVINLADVPLRDNGHGDEFEAKIGSFGRMIGSTGIGAMLHVVEPGKTAFPFHVHHRTHELFVDPRRRGQLPLRRGDAIR